MPSPTATLTPTPTFGSHTSLANGYTAGRRRRWGHVLAQPRDPDTYHCEPQARVVAWKRACLKRPILPGGGESRAHELGRGVRQQCS